MTRLSKIEMGTPNKIVILSILAAENNFKQILNNVVEHYTTTNNEDDVQLNLCLTLLNSSATPARIQHYIDRVVNHYTALEFQQNFRVPLEAFEKLLTLVGCVLSKEQQEPLDSTLLRRDLLAVTWLLATPDSYRSVGERFDMAKSTLSKAFVKIVDVLNNVSRHIIKWPDSSNRNEIEEGFRRMGGLPGIIGAVDGTYVKIDAPPEHADEYINRKRYHSITLQAICDHTLKFTDCFVGYRSSVHDCRIFRNSDIYKSVSRNPQEYFPDRQMILGDKAYPSLMWCLVPFKENGTLTAKHRFFNQQHSKTRQTIERSFALLFGRFRRLKHLQLKRLDYISKTVLAACVFHNVCLEFSDDLSFMEDIATIDGENREAENTEDEIDTLFQENSDEALQLRMKICNDL